MTIGICNLCQSIAEKGSSAYENGRCPKMFSCSGSLNYYKKIQESEK